MQTQMEGLAMIFKEIWTVLDCLGYRQMVNKCRLDKCAAEDRDRYQTVVNMAYKCGLNRSDQDNKSLFEHINETAVWDKSWEFIFQLRNFHQISVYMYIFLAVTALNHGWSTSWSSRYW